MEHEASPGLSCCVVDRNQPCPNTSNLTSSTKRLQRALSTGDGGLSINTALPSTYICSTHKEMIASSTRSKRKRRGTADQPPPPPRYYNSTTPPPSPARAPPPPPSPVDETCIMDNLELELGHLQLLTLRKYRKYFKLQVRAGISRQQLAETIIKHFRNMPVKEKEVIEGFLKAANRRNEDPDKAKDSS